MLRKITASRPSHPPSSSKGKFAVEDVPEEDVHEQMNDAEEERTMSDNNDSGESDENYEGSDDEDENENDEVAPDPTPFIGLDVSKIKSEWYTILRHIN